VLEDDGFTGFVPFAALDTTEVPSEPGVYVVLRTDTAAPRYLHTSGAGWFKERDPSVSIDSLETAWVDGARVLYIGKAGAGKRGTRGLR